MRIIIEMITVAGGIVTIANFALQRLVFKPRRHRQLEHNDYVREKLRENKELDELQKQLSNERR